MRSKASVLVSLIVVGAGCFCAGMKYNQRKAAASLSSASAARGNFANMTDAERQSRAQQFGANGGAGQRGGAARMAGGGFVAGEILSKDDQSITVKLADGGSKIILFSDSTKITKSSDGSKDDLSIGANVSINGSANSDGSITAQNIQLR